MNSLSYTSASVFPVKVLSQDIIASVKNHGIKPIHIQLNPTNKCNLKCSFCSCSNKDDVEMTFSQVCDILTRFKKLGTKAVTISGGGDPLCHPDINQIIRKCNELGIDVGLVTNAILLDKLDSDLNITWCRISLSGENIISEKTKNKILQMPQVDWAFSYVIIPGKFDNVTKAVNLANELKMTHIRIVDDILDPNTSYIEDIKVMLKSKDIDESRVIYQGRKSFTRGTKTCLISLLKPSIDAHGLVYPCCGVQYALEKPLMDYEPSMCMGNNYENIWGNQRFFDGSICHKCYYSNYNNLLNIMWDSESVEHQNFV